MFGRKEYKITEVEFNKLKDEFRALQEENARLKARNNFENLLGEINNLTATLKASKEENKELRSEIASLTNTLNNERHSAKLILAKLHETLNMCERSYRSQATEYIKAIDILC